MRQRSITLTHSRVGRGFKFVVTDPNLVQYEQFVTDNSVLHAVAKWLHKRDFTFVEEAVEWLDRKVGNIFTFRCPLKQFLDMCPLSGLEEVCDPVERSEDETRALDNVYS